MTSASRFAPALPRVMSQPTVKVVESGNELPLVFLGIRLRTPRVDKPVGLLPVDAAVRTAVERNKQQRLRLFGTNQRQEVPNRAEQPLESFVLPQDCVGGELQRVELAAHHVALEPEVAVLAQYLPRRLAVLLSYALRRVEPAHRLVQLCRQTVCVQTRVDVAVLRIEGDDLILAGLHHQQRYVHAVLDAGHHLLPPRTGLYDDAGLHTLELPRGDAHAVTLHQPSGLGDIERQDAGIGGGHPPEILHLRIGEVGIVLSVSVADPRQKTVLGQKAFHPVDFGLRCMYEDVVEEQRMARIDQRAVPFACLDVRGGEIFERRLTGPLPTLQFALQPERRVALIEPLARSGQRQHVPSDDIAVFPDAYLLGNRILPAPGIALGRCHG